MAISRELLDVLACPVCVREKAAPPSPLRRGEMEDLGSGLRCTQCGRVYPVRDGIPVMLVEEASGPGEAGGPERA